MTTEQELNEKLAKFLGWKPIHDYKGIIRFLSPARPGYSGKRCHCTPTRTNTDNFFSCTQWVKPDNSRSLSLPDFTHSLDDCLEYLGPKFETWDLAKVRTSNLPENNTYYYRAVLRTSEGRDFKGVSEISLSLAFCLAAEQAIDKGAKV